MKYLFDASSIFEIIKAGNLKSLVDGYTTDLARFELGNVIWKEVNLTKRISFSEGERMIALIIDALGLMGVVETLDLKEVLLFATKHKLTYYDASYAYASIKNKLVLVTEDNELRKNSSGFTKVVSAKDIGVD